jgi:TRAP-type transport system periplasmic protein
VFDTLTPAEYDRWNKATESVNAEWIKDASEKGGNGKALLDDARALIKKYGG